MLPYEKKYHKMCVEMSETYFDAMNDGEIECMRPKDRDVLPYPFFEVGGGDFNLCFLHLHGESISVHLTLKPFFNAKFYSLFSKMKFSFIASPGDSQKVIYLNVGFMKNQINRITKMIKELKNV